MATADMTDTIKMSKNVFTSLAILIPHHLICILPVVLFTCVLLIRNNNLLNIVFLRTKQKKTNIPFLSNYFYFLEL